MNLNIHATVTCPYCGHEIATLWPVRTTNSDYPAVLWRQEPRVMTCEDDDGPSCGGVFVATVKIRAEAKSFEVVYTQKDEELL